MTDASFFGRSSTGTSTPSATSLGPFSAGTGIDTRPVSVPRGRGVCTPVNTANHSPLFIWGAARAIPMEHIEVSGTGPRGGTIWEPLAAVAARTEQLRLM